MSGMDSVIDQVYSAARQGNVYAFWFQEMAMSKFPYAPIVIIVIHIINGTMGVHIANRDKPRQYWLHSLVTTILGCFGGGILTPILLASGKQPVIFANELAIPCTILIWYLINYCGFDHVFRFKPVKFFFTVMVALWRTNATINNVILGCTMGKPSPYYPTPLAGPLIAGTLINVLGAFFPFDKGLGPIQKGTVWTMQSAFISSAMYYFIVMDREGFMGIAVRSVVGDLSHRTVAGLICGFQMITLAAQAIFDDPNVNFFTPIHKVGYAVFGFEGPPAPAAPPAKRPILATTKGVVHALFFAFVTLYFMSFRVPPVTLPAISRPSYVEKGGVEFATLTAVPSAGLSLDQPIGSCQWKAALPFMSSSCSSYALRLEEHHICHNSTCGSPIECMTPSRSGCTVAALKGNHIDRAEVRLAVHPSAGVHNMPSLVRSSNALSGSYVNANMQWATSLPLELLSAEQVLGADPKFQFNKVSLFVTEDSELLLLYNAQFAGSIFDPTQLEGKVLWRGFPKYTCGADADTVGSTAKSLYLAASSGFPRMRCSDGSSVELHVGGVYKYGWAGKPDDRRGEVAPHTIAATVDVRASSAKAEL